MVNWENTRANKFSNARPDDWPKDVIAISLDGLTLFGIHEGTGALYWDGKEVVLRRTVRFGPLELWLIGLGAAGAFGSFLVEGVRLLFEHRSAVHAVVRWIAALAG
jgi:hypothetical protein